MSIVSWIEIGISSLTHSGKLIGNGSVRPLATLLDFIIIAILTALLTFTFCVDSWSCLAMRSYTFGPMHSPNMTNGQENLMMALVKLRRVDYLTLPNSSGSTKICCHDLVSTLCLKKKFPPLNSLWHFLSNLNRFSKKWGEVGSVVWLL